jgi:hypothetical protein
MHAKSNESLGKRQIKGKQESGDGRQHTYSTATDQFGANSGSTDFLEVSATQAPA